MMKKTVFLSLFFLSVITGEVRAVSLSDSLSIAPFGRVFVYKQTSVPDNIIIMISGDAGWKYGVVDFAKTFSEMNSLVIGVDIIRYFKDLRNRTGDCYTVAADFVQLATEIEKKYNFPEYKPPVIMGYSSGATLVYGILAQARPGTFVGGISIGFCPDIELPKMLCQTNGLAEKIDIPGKSYILQPDAKLGNSWIVLQGKLDKVCNYSEVSDFVNKTGDAELITLPNVGHGFSKWSDFMPQWKDAYKRLTGKSNKSEKAEKSEISEKVSSPDTEAGKVKNVPVIITKAKSQNNENPIALLVSGDGGWYGFEQSIADNLAKLGIPTLGLDSKKYFWNRRSPEETAGDMARLLSFYSKEWGNERFILIGYSLGAEIVPFIVNRVPEEIRSKIISTVLLSPEIFTDFEIHISNMIGMGNRQNTYNVIDEIIKMQSIPSLVIFGESEKSKVPGLLTGTSAKIKLIPGDHHYKFNLPLIMQTMKDNKTF
jgi:type IV secretory pathway VirJ component